MQHRVLVVTGGSRGIGAATAMLGAARGYRVVVNYAGNADAAAAVVGSISGKGGVSTAVQGDVSIEADVERIFAAADGLGTVSALVNNAGVVPVAARVDALDPADLAKLLAINVTGSFLCARAAIRRMSSRFGGSGGAIVNLSSAAAKLGAPGSGVHYAASKGAIDSFTIGLALELAGEGIRVNAVRPGIIDTEMHASGGDPDRAKRMAPSLPMPRAGTPEEVARAILWLLSDDASYTTGSILAVSGGRAILP